MARNERVTYECDVCGESEKATKMTQEPTGKGSVYIRPDGWGSVYIQVQEIGPQKISRKADFCSEECLKSFLDSFLDAAYGD